jgi:N utilization substance protein B
VKNSRRRAREFALQATYQWLLNASDADVLLAHLRELEGFAKADPQLAESLVRGVTADAEALRTLIAPSLDRDVTALSPVEHALLLLAALELRDHAQTPYKVVINEAVELGKSYGGTDGHKYVNGVLDKLAARLRPDEIRASRAKSS